MRIAVIGSGISGLACAHYLHDKHQVEVFEAASRIGGHTATVDVALGGKRYAIDTGFIVYNDWTYPNFMALMDSIGVPGKPSEMSFAVSDRISGLEYAGSSLNTLFAQRRNLVSPRFWGMVRDILRFNRQAPQHLESGLAEPDMTLGEYLRRQRYGEAFIRQYLVPMGSAIWSADTPAMLDFPLQFFIRFFRNHGLLNIFNRPQWHVIEGGSRQYLAPLCQGFAENIHLDSPVHEVRRLQGQVEIQWGKGRSDMFDQVVFACHSNQALAVLRDPLEAEREILGALPYQDNEVILHTDIRLLPRNRSSWSSWNYQINSEQQRAVVTYNMNILQGIEAPETFCVTLNHTEAINPNKILGRFNYAHPVFSLPGVQAQQRWGEINGSNATWYCGAYWHNGFHEDGVTSALRVAQGIEAQQSLPGVSHALSAA